MDGPLLRALIYGDTGSGKTYFVGTATEDSRAAPVLVLNSRGQPITFRLFPEPPLVLDVLNMVDFNAPWQWIMNGQEWSQIEGMNDMPPSASGAVFARAVYDYFDRSVVPVEERKFKTIAIDGLTWTQRTSLNQTVGNMSVLPGTMPKRADLQDWGNTLAQMTNLADLYYQLPIHVILTALAKHDMIETYGTVMYYPALWGQSRLELPSLAELTARMIPIESMNAQQVSGLEQAMPEEMATAYNAMVTRGGRAFIAKWQGIRNNPEVILNPNISKVLDVLYEQ